MIQKMTNHKPKNKLLLNDSWARGERVLNIVAAIGTIIVLAEPLRDMWYRKVLKKEPPKATSL